MIDDTPSRYMCHAIDLGQFRRYRRGKNRCKTCGGLLSLAMPPGVYVREMTAEQMQGEYITV